MSEEKLSTSGSTEAFLCGPASATSVWHSLKFRLPPNGSLCNFTYTNRYLWETKNNTAQKQRPKNKAIFVFVFGYAYAQLVTRLLSVE